MIMNLKTRVTPKSYQAITLPAVRERLLSTGEADYLSVTETAYEPITGGVHVRRVALERIPKSQNDT